MMTEYENAMQADKNIQALRKKIAEEKAGIKELNKLASLAGKLMGICATRQLQEEFPDGHASKEDVRKIISPILRKNHQFVSEMAAAVQNAQYKRAGVGLKATIPEYNLSRENDLIEDIVQRSFADELDG